jgi:hypothetical protein
MTLLDTLAPGRGALLDLELGGPLEAAKAAHRLLWLPLRVADAVVGEMAALPPEAGFLPSVQLWRDGDKLASVELHVGIERGSQRLLDALEKQVKTRLRARLGPYSKDKLRDSRPHWLEAGDLPRVWLVLRWVTPELAWLKVCCSLSS